MNCKRAISIIESLRKGWYSPPSFYYQKKVRFEYHSYQHSALKEIEKSLMLNDQKDPIEILEDFKWRMDCFACGAKNESTNFMFSVYCDVATDVLDVLLSYYKEDE